ncbi:MAG: polyphenol oxidase family protein [bacterium]
MTKALDIIKPQIFPTDEIISGVTKANKDLFPPYGFSISKGEIYNQEQIDNFKQILADQLGIPYEQLKLQKQVHCTECGDIDTKSAISETDAMITNEKGIVLGLSLADCGGILVYEPKAKVVAAIHSGWRGSKERIVEKTIKKMVSEYNCSVSDMLFYIAPSACVFCYEVGDEFIEYFPETTIRREGQPYFDNKTEIVKQILASGGERSKIEISPICTIEDIDFHSFRRDKSLSGRMCAFIGLI